MIVKFIDYLRDRLKTVIKLCYLMLGLLVIIDMVLVDKHHAHTWMEHLPGFWSMFGFGACVIIIVVSKWYGHVKWFGSNFRIMSPEDYYDN
jgi:predicted tellurium resistance membrane protein TerC